MQIPRQTDTIQSTDDFFLPDSQNFNMNTRTRRTSRIFTALSTFAAAALVSVTTVLAQEGERQGGAVAQSQTSIVEYLLVAALFGAALFAVCRTSHRV